MVRIHDLLFAKFLMLLESQALCVYDVTLQVLWYQWAIGTTPGSTDIQEFSDLGAAQFGINGKLEGILQDNHTYYATLRAINGAGLTTTVISSGV